MFDKAATRFAVLSLVAVPLLAAGAANAAAKASASDSRNPWRSPYRVMSKSPIRGTPRMGRFPEQQVAGSAGGDKQNLAVLAR